MNEISCEVIKDLLPIYADAICSDDTKLLVSQHLEHCSDCRRVYEQITRHIPMDSPQQEPSVISLLSRRWRRDKKRAFLIGFLSLLLIVTGSYTFLNYSFRHPAPVSGNVVTVSNLSELENGDIFFTLEVPDRLYVMYNNWVVRDHAVYITMDYFKYNIFNQRIPKYDFGKNTPTKSNWMFNVEKAGINQIYYCSKAPEDTETPVKNSILIWSTDGNIAKADSTVQTYIKTYSCYGNEEVGAFANILYGSKNPYVGDMPANQILLGSLNIVTSLGSYQNSLQTGEEPYGWTLEFKNFVASEDEATFNATMTKYAYLMLALTGNLGEVTWTYPLNDGTQIIKKTLTAKEASTVLGSDIKNYSESPIKIQELLLAINMKSS